jgi:hypothetical protein
MGEYESAVNTHFNRAQKHRAPGPGGHLSGLGPNSSLPDSFLFADNARHDRPGLRHISKFVEYDYLNEVPVYEDQWSADFLNIDTDLCDNVFNVFPSGLIFRDGIVKKSSTLKSSQFGTYETQQFLWDLAKKWYENNSDNPIRVGDISKKGGKESGPHPPHTGHRLGVEIDIGLFRTDKMNEGLGLDKAYNSPLHDWKKTQELVDILDKDPNVVKIIINDPRIKGNKVVRDPPGKNTHDNHVHVVLDNCDKKGV